MKAIVIEVTNEADNNFWLKLAKRTGTKAKLINTDDIKDVALATLIKEGMTTKSINRESVIELLAPGKED